MLALDMITGAGLVLAGSVLGRTVWAPSTLRHQIEKLKEKPEPEVKPVCGCTHALAFHNTETGVCTGRGNNGEDPIIKNGQVVAWQGRPCACAQYTGPRPVDTFFTPRSTM